MALLAPFLLTCSSTGAMESWSDDRLSVVAGLQLWFDASHQNAGRTELQLAPLGSGNAVDYLLDGTGHQRHLVQSHRERRPSFRQEFNGAYLSFDGKDDCLSASLAGLSLTNLTLFLVTAPATNEGDFRAFCALNRAGHNDYLSGLNLDLGPVATPQFLVVNAEGNGFGGASQLWRGHGAPFRGWHTLALECQSGPGGVRLFVDGRAQGSRDRQDSVLRADEFVLGARHYSNTGEPPYTQGFLKGDIAEVLLFDRLLSEKERATVQEYLSRKYGLLLGRPPGALDDSKPLVSVTNPPPVQMLLPGFAVRELPLSLKNINNVKYRGDGKLVALGYDGRIDLLADTDGDGLEDRAEPFWTNPANAIRSPIGMALTPAGYSRGQGAFVAAKGRLSLIVDTNGDDRADEEVIVAEGWKELAHGVDALGVAIDRGGNVFFGLGTASFTEAYLVDKTTGQSRYDLKSERGTILKVSPDFKTREIVCTGIRFPVALAFNQLGDLFCTDQEGATWLPNGNPFDELLHIQTGRHYGFPPRHPRYLPKVVDEPSVFDYAPQHQSTCGLTFNQSVNGGPVFGPAAWTGDALVCGYSRGKIWRTKLVKTAAGYVAQSQLIASLPTLAVDAGVSPRGDLIVATHSGDPDWGSGPNGLGHLYRIRYADRAIPQPVLAWPGGPAELRVALDRPVDPLTLKDLAKHTEITQGQIVVAGERFEVKRPGYAVVYSQMGLPRYDIAVEGIAVTPDLRTLILKTRPIDAAAPLAVTFHDLGKSWGEVGGDDQVPDVDLVVDLNGLSAHWESTGVPANAEPPREAASDLWLPHLDLDVARALTRTSADHDRFWEMLQHPGTLRLRTQLDLWQMLQPAVQPGSKLDYERPVEQVSVAFEANTPFTLRSQDTALSSQPAADGKHRLVWPHRGQSSWIPVEVSFKTGQVQPQFGLTWSTADDSRWRPFPLRRLVVPWARQQSSATGTSPERAVPELAGGRWLRGKHIFFDETVACFKCHRIRGEGSTVGPDLSNLVHRDYASVFRDITQPNAALNPDHLAYAIELTDGEELSAVVQEENAERIMVANASGRVALPRNRIKAIRPSGLSLMPEGFDKTLTRDQLRDLMTFLLTQPLTPVAPEINGQPAPRTRAEVDLALKGVQPVATDTTGRSQPFSIVLCAGPKDHGPGEHDYPLWQKRWAKLLSLADGVAVTTAWEWPSSDQWKAAQTVVFYSNLPGWNTARATELKAFLDRGGGAVFLHYAVDGHTNVQELADVIGLAWKGGTSKFRHGPLDLKLSPGPFSSGLSSLRLVDESYWNLIGTMRQAELVATGVEEGEAQPLIWNLSHGEGRVFVSIPGHYSWSFDDPLFRLLLLRGICWTGHQPLDRLVELISIGCPLPAD